MFERSMEEPKGICQRVFRRMAERRIITPRLAAALLCFVLGGNAQYDRCNGTVADIGDGRCDAALNTPVCGWDGGDVSSLNCHWQRSHCNVSPFTFFLRKHQATAYVPFDTAADDITETLYLVPMFSLRLAPVEEALVGCSYLRCFLEMLNYSLADALGLPCQVRSVREYNTHAVVLCDRLLSLEADVAGSHPPARATLSSVIPIHPLRHELQCASAVIVPVLTAQFTPALTTSSTAACIPTAVIQNPLSPRKIVPVSRIGRVMPFVTTLITVLRATTTGVM